MIELLRRSQEKGKEKDSVSDYGWTTRGVLFRMLCSLAGKKSGKQTAAGGKSKNVEGYASALMIHAKLIEDFMTSPHRDQVVQKYESKGLPHSHTLPPQGTSLPLSSPLSPYLSPHLSPRHLIASLSSFRSSGSGPSFRTRSSLHRPSSYTTSMVPYKYSHLELRTSKKSLPEGFESSSG